MYRLQSELQKRNISMRLVESERGIFKGYIGIPRSFESDGNVRVDELLGYTLRLFDANDKQKTPPKVLLQPVKKAKRGKEITKVTQTSKNPPLGATVKRIKSEKNKKQ